MINLHNLPDELLHQKRFFPVTITADGKKVPIDKVWQHPDNQMSYQDAIAKSPKGLAGFDISGHGRAPDYFFVDFDNVLDAEGNFIYPDAQKWFNYLSTADTFSETSISNHGCHFFFAPSPYKFPKLTGGKNCSIFFDKDNTDAKIELFYRQNRWCLVTGNLFHCEPNTPIVSGDIADEFVQQLFNQLSFDHSSFSDSDSPNNSTASDISAEDVQKMLAVIPCDKIPYEDWWKTAAIIHYHFNGDCFELWRAWSEIDKGRYSLDTCQKVWLDLDKRHSLDIGRPATIASLIHFAKQFGYIPPKIKHDSSTNLTPFDDCLELWRDSNHNDPIDTNVVSDLHNAFNFIDSLSTDSFSASLLFDIPTRRKVALCKFYIPKLAQKFFSILQASVRSAKDKIKELRAKKTPAVIPQDVQELADIKTIDFNSSVSSMVTQIKHDQKAFVKRFKAEQEKREFENMRKAFLENRPSTQKIISDCPIDLVLPESVYFGSHEIGIQTFSNKGELITKPAAKTPIVVLRIFREPSKHTTQYELAIKAKGVWRRVEVYGDEIADPRKILRLAKDGGALIKDARTLCNYFAELISANEEILTETKCYQQTGWLNGKFDNFIYPTVNDDYIVRRDGFNYDKSYASAGDSEKWKDVFIKACDDGGAIARVFLGNPLAAPLIAPLDLPNMQTHLVGEPNCGKSALLKLAASIYGDQTELIRTFAATLKNRQAVAAANSHLPTFLDELGTVTGGKKGEESLATMVYEFFEGKANQANKRDGTTREIFKFTGSRVSSAEHDMLKTNDAQGAYKRLLQLHCSKSLFDIDFAKKLHSFTKYNFGLFGKSWIDFVSSHQAEINAKKQEFFSLAKDNDFPCLKHVESTLLDNLVASSLSTQFFLVAIGAKQSFDNVQFVSDISEILASLPTFKDIDEAERARDSLISFFASHKKFFDREIKDSSADGFTSIPADAWTSYGKAFFNTEIAFYTVSLENILEKELGFASAKALIAKFATKGWLKFTKGKNFRCNSYIDGKTVATYRFKAGVLINSNSLSNDDIEHSA